LTEFDYIAQGSVHSKAIERLLDWLQKETDVAASSLLERLQAAKPEKYADDKTLRTLQRRIGQWRCIMAKQLVVGKRSRFSVIHHQRATMLPLGCFATLSSPMAAFFLHPDFGNI